MENIDQEKEKDTLLSEDSLDVNEDSLTEDQSSESNDDEHVDAVDAEDDYEVDDYDDEEDDDPAEGPLFEMLKSKANEDELKIYLMDNYMNKRCDMSKPFVFFSYSHSGVYNRYVVMHTFNTLYKKGYNLWIDLANLAKDESHWNVAARKAIFSENCKAVLFFRNEFSTINHNVYKELELSHARHVPIIPLDTWQFVDSASEYREFLIVKATAEPFLEFENVADVVSVEANSIQCKKKEGEIFDLPKVKYDNFKRVYISAEKSVKDIIDPIEKELNKKGVYNREIKNELRILSDLETEAMHKGSEDERMAVDRHFFELRSTVSQYDLNNKKATIFRFGLEDNKDCFSLLLGEVYALSKYSELIIPGWLRKIILKEDETGDYSVKRNYADIKDNINKNIMETPIIGTFMPIISEEERIRICEEKLLYIKVIGYLFAGQKIINLDKDISKKECPTYVLTDTFPPIELYNSNNSIRMVDDSLEGWSGFQKNRPEEESDVDKLKRDVRRKKIGSEDNIRYTVNFNIINDTLREIGWDTLTVAEQNKLLSDNEAYLSLITGNWCRCDVYCDEDSGDEANVEKICRLLIDQWSKYDIVKRFCARDKEKRKVIARVVANNSISSDTQSTRTVANGDIKSRYLGVLIQREDESYYLQSAREYYDDREKYEFYNKGIVEEKIKWIRGSKIGEDYSKIREELYIRESLEKSERTYECVEKTGISRVFDKYDDGSNIYGTNNLSLREDSIEEYGIYGEINENEVYQWWIRKSQHISKEEQGFDDMLEQWKSIPDDVKSDIQGDDTISIGFRISDINSWLKHCKNVGFVCNEKRDIFGLWNMTTVGDNFELKILKGSKCFSSKKNTGSFLDEINNSVDYMQPAETPCETILSFEEKYMPSLLSPDEYDKREKKLADFFNRMGLEKVYIKKDGETDFKNLFRLYVEYNDFLKQQNQEAGQP